MSQIGFVKAMKDFFGPLPGQSIMQFGLNSGPSHEEKLDFAQGFEPTASIPPIPTSPRWPPEPNSSRSVFCQRFTFSIEQGQVG